MLRAAAQGWTRLDQRAAAVADIVRAVHASPDALAAALARSPSTFLHGDPKMANLGLAADGRAILLDWAYPGVYGPIAAHMVGAAPHPLRWRVVLDGGAGTGLAGRELAAIGARVVALGLSWTCCGGSVRAASRRGR